MRDALSALSNDDLVLQLIDALKREDHAALDFVFKLAELSDRRVHLEQGYDSLYTFCLKRLGLDESRAYRRSAAACLVARYPLVRSLLREERISLSALLALNGVLTPENHMELLQRAAGMTESEARRLAAELRPLPVPRDSVRLVYTLRPAPPPTPSEGPAPRFTFGPKVTTVGAETTPPLDPMPPLVLTEVHRFETTLSKETNEQLLAVKAALSHRIPDGNLPDILAECFRITLKVLERQKIGAPPSDTAPPPAAPPVDERGPATARASDSNRSPDPAAMTADERGTDVSAPRITFGPKVTTSGSTPESGPIGAQSCTPSTDAAATAAALRSADHEGAPLAHDGDGTTGAPESNVVTTREPARSPSRRRSRLPGFDEFMAAVEAAVRNIKMGVRRAVWVRDGGCCSFVGSTGRRCGSTYQVEFDHTEAYALGGEGTVENIRLLCHKHNFYEAERVFGREFMAQFRERGGQLRAPRPPPSASTTSAEPTRSVTPDELQ